MLELCSLNRKVEDRNRAGHNPSHFTGGSTDTQFQFIPASKPRASPTILIPPFLFVYFIVFK